MKTIVQKVAPLTSLFLSLFLWFAGFAVNSANADQTAAPLLFTLSPAPQFEVHATFLDGSTRNATLNIAELPSQGNIAAMQMMIPMMQFGLLHTPASASTPEGAQALINGEQVANLNADTNGNLVGLMSVFHEEWNSNPACHFAADFQISILNGANQGKISILFNFANAPTGPIPGQPACAAVIASVVRRDGIGQYTLPGLFSSLFNQNILTRTQITSATRFEIAFPFTMERQ